MSEKVAHAAERDPGMNRFERTALPRALHPGSPVIKPDFRRIPATVSPDHHQMLARALTRVSRLPAPIPESSDRMKIKASNQKRGYWFDGLGKEPFREIYLSREATTSSL